MRGFTGCVPDPTRVVRREKRRCRLSERLASNNVRVLGHRARWRCRPNPSFLYCCHRRQLCAHPQPR
jgi:hypothetical protein